MGEAETGASIGVLTGVSVKLPRRDTPLLLPEGHVLDLATLRPLIAAACAGRPDTRTARTHVARLLAEAKAKANATLERAFALDPRNALPLIHSQARLTDGLLVLAYEATEALHPLQIKTDAERLCVLAVGGFGRSEMAPHSDVDLLFVFPWKITSRAESVIETLLYILWDLKLKVGHASRTIKDCLRLGREDITIRTALLEHRYISGDQALATELDDKLWSDLFRTTGREFIDAKLAERGERHKRQGGQRYVLEPNVKEAKGGLRDLQTLYWIGKYLHRVPSAEGLVGAGLLTAEEFAIFQRAENFLWAARSHMHYITKRTTDQLTFDLQVEVA